MSASREGRVGVEACPDEDAGIDVVMAAHPEWVAEAPARPEEILLKRC